MERKEVPACFSQVVLHVAREYRRNEDIRVYTINEGVSYSEKIVSNTQVLPSVH